MTNTVEPSVRMRFSDETLFEFHKEFKAHVDKTEERFQASEKRFDQFIITQQKNTDAMMGLIEDTESLVQFSKDIDAIKRVAVKTQSFFTWFIKWPVIIGVIYSAATWISKNFPS